MTLKTTIAGLALALFVASPLGAQPQSTIHFSGHSWETGGYPPSNVNDVFQCVGIVNDIQAPLYWQPWQYSYTIYLRQLVSVGETVFGNTRIVTYGGGLLTVYRDGLPDNSDYGTNPPNATSPSTFTDGNAIYLDGYFVNFTLTFNQLTRAGTFTGTLNFTGGIVFPRLLNPDGWTLGSDVAGLSPTGYDLQLNGTIYANGPISVESESWGGIKSLYR